MNNFFYPDKEAIKIWLNFLRSENSSLNLKLPNTDDQWFKGILDTMDRVRLVYSDNVHGVASRLFYYLDKDHNFVDGNKRSTILMVYLFYILNGYRINSPEKIRVLAKKVAKSMGSKNMDSWLIKIEKELKSITSVIY